MDVGAHFFSDIVFAGVLMYLVVFTAHGLIYRWPATRLDEKALRDSRPLFEQLLRIVRGIAAEAGTPQGGCPTTTRSHPGTQQRASPARRSSPRPSRASRCRSTCSRPRSRSRASTSASTIRWTWSAAPRSASRSLQLFACSYEPGDDHRQRRHQADPDSDPPPARGEEPVRDRDHANEDEDRRERAERDHDEAVGDGRRESRPLDTQKAFISRPSSLETGGQVSTKGA